MFLGRGQYVVEFDALRSGWRLVTTPAARAGLHQQSFVISGSGNGLSVNVGDVSGTSRVHVVGMQLVATATANFGLRNLEPLDGPTSVPMNIGTTPGVLPALERGGYWYRSSTGNPLVLALQGAFTGSIGGTVLYFIGP